jgi:hypothetical protein
VLWGNSRAVLWGNSRAVLRENSSAELWGNSSAYLESNGATVELNIFSVAFLIAPKAKAVKRSKTATVIKPKISEGIKGWLQNNAVIPKGGKVILYKRVSEDFKTQEKTSNETLWTIGTILEHPAWEPTKQECGGGKFHACGRASVCDQYRDTINDKYIALEVAVKDLYAWPKPEHPYKIAVRKAKVLYECDKWGEKVKP